MKTGSWRRKLNSFGFQIAFFYLAAGLTLLLLFGAVVYTVVSDIFVQEAVEKTRMSIEKDAQSIGERLRYTQIALEVAGQNPVFATAGENQDLLRQLDTLHSAVPDLFGVYALLPDGRLHSSSGAAALSPGLTQGLLERKNAAQPQFSAMQGEGYPHSDPWVITLSVPLASGEGLLVANLDYCLFKHTFGDMNLGGSGSVFVVDETGGLVFHTDTACMATGSGEAYTVPSFFGYDKASNTLTHSAAIAGTGWTMVGIASLDSLKTLQGQLLNLVALTGMLLFLALLVITLVFSKKLSTPLARLAHSMEDIESLQELSLLAGEVSETQMLTESYNRMIGKIRLLMQQLEQKQTELRQREMDALSSQINPHFLYNTLDTIVWLAEFRDNDKIIALTKSLAAFFRLSLSGGRAVVSLDEELEHVRQYLFIQKERYGDKLSDSFTVEEGLGDCLLPKIILQPLVENALYHGIKPKEGPGHICIEAKRCGEALLLRVQDDGVGFSENPPEAGAIGGSGVGLRNVERRIQLYFGGDSKLVLRSAPGAGTTAELLLCGALPPPRPGAAQTTQEGQEGT